MRTPKNVHLWLPGYLQSLTRSRPDGLIDVLFCIADHFEPENRGADPATRLARVRRWREAYPRLAEHYRDADGMPPRHTFFISAEAYAAELVDPLAELSHAGLGEVEVHLHHENDSAENLRRTLLTFTSNLAERHGLLSVDDSGRVVFGFIHGNWALDNSLTGGRHCGVDNELSVLLETGCYADFTMPAVPSESQSRVVNAIYLAVDNPARPASHRRGSLARAQGRIGPHQLMMIPGPLQLSWRRRRHGLLPRIDTGTIDYRNAPTVERFERWVRAAVGVAGQPRWIFVKVHTHGAPEENASLLLGSAMRDFHEALATGFNDGRRFRLHYVSAREMANIACAAVAGRTGNPGDYRDFRFRAISPLGVAPAAALSRP
jgi:hypothetical protein